MLTDTSIKTAYTLASVISDKNHKLQAVTGTPLADVMRAMEPIDPGILVDGEDAPLETVDEIVKARTADDINGHDDVMQGIREKAAGAVRYTMRLSRNTVVPMTRDLVDRTTAYLENYHTRNTQNLTIQPRFLPNLFTLAACNELISPYKDEYNVEIEPIQLNHEWSGSQEGLTDLYTGIRELDEAIDSYYLPYYDEVKIKWEKFFGSTDGVYRDFRFLNEVDNLFNAGIIFFGANKLIADEQVPEGLSVSLLDYRTYLAKIRAQAGMRVAYHVKTMVDSRNGNRLVVSAPKTSRRFETLKGMIVVEGEVYNQWLEEGGTAEALLGAVSQGAELSYKGLLANADDYRNYWERIQNINEIRVKANITSTTINGLHRSLLEMLKGEDYSELDVDMKELQTLIEDCLGEITPTDLENLYLTARNLLCNTVFCHTDAGMFLDSYDLIAKNKPQLTTREVALYASIEYITDWIGNQISIDKA